MLYQLQCTALFLLFIPADMLQSGLQHYFEADAQWERIERVILAIMNRITKKRIFEGFLIS